MSFFNPVLPPLMEEGSAPIIRHAFQRAKIVGNFAIVQAIVQIIGFLSGILLVRTLEQREYAYFTIANTMQGTINLLADIGSSAGPVSIGGRVWQDRHRFGQLISTALSVRRKLGAVAISIVTPVLYFLLVKNGASFFYTVVLIVVVLAGLLIQLSLGVLDVVPRLRSDIARIESIDLTGAIARLLVLFALMYFFLNAGLAVPVATATLLLQYTMLRKYVAGVIDLDAPENAEDRAAMFGFIRKLAANAVFYCLQGQIAVFLISFFSRRTSSVAEVGALGRLAMIFAAIIGGVSAFSLLVLCGAEIFPDQFLFVLGSKYAHLHRELLLMVGGAVLSALTGTFWALNASKAWVAGSWLYIPLTLAAQIALIPFTDFSSVM